MENNNQPLDPNEAYISNEQVSQKKNFEQLLPDERSFIQSLLQKNRRSYYISLFLVLMHLVELFSLVLRSRNFFYSSGLMPTFHIIITSFNLKFLIPQKSHDDFLYGLFIFNVIIIALGYFTMTRYITGLPKKNFFRKQLLGINLMLFQIYNWIILVPALHFCGFMLQNFEINSIITILTLLLSIIIASLYEYFDISTSFKIQDYLARNRSFSARIIFNYKLLVCIITGLNYFNESLMFTLYIWTAAQFLRSPPFHSYDISKIYFAGLSISIYGTVLYFFASQNFLIKVTSLDFAYMLFFAGSILAKFSVKLLDQTITRKIEGIIGSKTAVSLEDFQLYNREIYRHYRLSLERDLDSKIIFLTFFNSHLNQCQDVGVCPCKTIVLDDNKSLRKNKKALMMLIDSRFESYLKENENEKQLSIVFLNYCSFVLSILKTPSRVLNLIFTMKDKIKDFEAVIQMNILVKKSKKLLEKKLLNNDQYAQTLASVIFFDKDVKYVESKLKKVLEDMIKLHEILLKESNANERFLSYGNNIIQNLEKFKTKIMQLLDKNVRNTRLLQLTALTIKYLTEDLIFRNYYKQLNIKRINQNLLKKKHDKLDIFDNDSGIVFISLGTNLGSIEKVSKNFIKIFGFTESGELIGKNINILMPGLFSLQHDNYLKEFLRTGRGNFLTSGIQNLYGVNREGILFEIQLLIRLDTVFHDEFVVAGYAKIKRNVNNKVIMCDLYGNLMNYTKELKILFGFLEKQNDKEKIKVNMAVFMPELLERLFPTDIDLLKKKEFLDFKQKGFILLPKSDEEYDFTEFFDESFSLNIGISENFEEKFLHYKQKIYSKLRRISPHHFSFNRVHYIVKTLSFTESNESLIRVFEIQDIFELNEPKLFSQYITKKTDQLKNLLRNLVPDESDFEKKSEIKTTVIQSKTKKEDFLKTLKYKSGNLTIPKNEEKDEESSVSSNQKNAEAEILPTPSGTFDLESEFSLPMDNNEMLFEQRISEISNNQAQMMSSEDSITNEENRTQTIKASQISRVSSHASGDNKKTPFQF